MVTSKNTIYRDCHSIRRLLHTAINNLLSCEKCSYKGQYMNDNNDNVIDMFKRSVKGSSNFSNQKEELLGNYPYIKLTKDVNGNYFTTKTLLEYSQKIYYIVTVMKDCTPSAALYKYKVAQADLTNFLNELSKNSSYGVIIEIDKYIPEDLA